MLILLIPQNKLKKVIKMELNYKKPSKDIQRKIDNLHNIKLDEQFINKLKVNVAKKYVKQMEQDYDNYIIMVCKDKERYMQRKVNKMELFISKNQIEENDKEILTDIIQKDIKDIKKYMIKTFPLFSATLAKLEKRILKEGEDIQQYVRDIDNALLYSLSKLLFN